MAQRRLCAEREKACGMSELRVRRNLTHPDLHWYPEAEGRIRSDLTPVVEENRTRSPRSHECGLRASFRESDGIYRRDRRAIVSRLRDTGDPAGKSLHHRRRRRMVHRRAPKLPPSLLKLLESLREDDYISRRGARRALSDYPLACRRGCVLTIILRRCALFADQSYHRPSTSPVRRVPRREPLLAGVRCQLSG